MNKTIIALLVVSSLCACGGGSTTASNSSTTPVTPSTPVNPSTPAVDPSVPSNPSTPAVSGKLSFTPVKDISALVGSQKVVTTAARSTYGFNVISEAVADGLVSTVEFVATDAVGAKFKVSFVDANGGSVVTEITTKFIARVDDDTAVVELLDTTPSLPLFQHWLLQYSTGKMIKLEESTSGSIQHGSKLVERVLPPHSIFNTTDKVVMMMADKKWYSVTPDWSGLTSEKVYVTDEVLTAAQDYGNVMVTSSGVYTMGSDTKDSTAVFALKFNGEPMNVGGGKIMYLASIGDKAYAYSFDDSNLYLLNGTEATVSAVFEWDMTNIQPSYFIKATETQLVTKGCSVFNIVDGKLVHEFGVNPSEYSADSVMAGESMTCLLQPRAGSTNNVSDTTSPFPNDLVCDRNLAPKTFVNYDLINRVEKRVEGIKGAIMGNVPTSRSSTYIKQQICEEAGGDGISAAKWNAHWVDSEINFDTNEVRPLDAPVVMSIVN